MPLTSDDVRRIASLAGLRLAPEEAGELVPQMAELVRVVEEMAAPEGEGEAGVPLSGPVREGEDVPRPGLDREVVLSNAPEHREGHVRLPPVRPSAGGPDRDGDGEAG